MQRFPKRSDSRISYSEYASAIRTIRKLENICFDSSQFQVRQDVSGMYISMLPQAPSSGIDWSIMPFGIDSLSGNELVLLPGSLDYCVPGGVFSVSTNTTVTLSGQPAWVYLESHRVTHATSVVTTPVAVRPESTADVIRVPLYRFESTDGGVTYEMAYWALIEPRAASPKI